MDGQWSERKDMADPMSNPPQVATESPTCRKLCRTNHCSKLDRWPDSFKRDIPCKVKFMAQVPVIIDQNMFGSVKFRQEGYV